MRKNRRALLYIVCLVIAAGLLWVVRSLREQNIMDARRRDVEALTRICLESTDANIGDTDELLALAERRHIKLNSPIPRDPSRPCYRLVNPYSATAGSATPNRILIEETNTTDERRIFVSTMDGSIFVRPRRSEAKRKRRRIS